MSPMTLRMPIRALAGVLAAALTACNPVLRPAADESSGSGGSSASPDSSGSSADSSASADSVSADSGRSSGWSRARGSRAVVDSGGWRPAPFRLATRWATEVDPANPLPEYPRPQLVRERWMSLNGVWQLAVAGEGEAPPLGRDLPRRVLVPFAVESALSGIGEHHPRVWYRRTFRVPAGWTERVLLHFGAVDWAAEVWVNGTRVGDHRGGYDAFSFDVTDALRPGGEQEVVVGVFDPTDAGTQPRGKQVERPRSIWYSPVTGIWRTVWMEPVPAARIAALRMTPDLDASALRLSADVDGARPGDRVRAVARADGRIVGTAEGAADGELRLALPRPRLWSPDDPYLYDLRVSLLRGGAAADSVASYFGMRSIALGRDSAGSARLLLNGEPLFQVGPLDQGWWPDGLYTAPTDEALRWDLEATKALGFNMTRKHVKVEPARWYHWADRLGLLVWQDMPSGRAGDAEGRRQFEAELGEMVRELGNHPSIVLWVPFNEGWGQFDAPRIAAEVRRMDPSRLVTDASGWIHAGAGDVVDVHRYQAPQALPRDSLRATVVGEFGGLGRVVPGHAWAGEGWGYAGTYASADSLAARYGELLGRMWRLRDTHGMSAGVYTQLTDVELEVNGLFTYDRAVLKMDSAALAAVDRGVAPVILPATRELTDSARVEIVQGTPTEVRYTTDGSDPSPSSPLYGGPWTVRGDVDVAARAFVDGAPVGPVARAAFRRTAGLAPASVPGAVPGIAYQYFEADASRGLTRLTRAGPDSLSATSAGVLPGFSLAPARRGEMFALRYTGFLRVPRRGVYTLTAAADDALRLWVGGRAVIDAMGHSPGRTENAGSVALDAGLHPVTLHFFQAYGPSRLEVWIEGPGLPRQPADPFLFRAPSASAAAQTRDSDGA